MQPLGFLLCLGKALERQARGVDELRWDADLASQMSRDLWDDWQRDRDEDRRRAELKAIVDMSAKNLRKQVVEVMREVALELELAKKQSLAKLLVEIAEVLRQAWQRADTGASVIPLTGPSDLADLLSPERKVPLPRVTLVQIDGALKGREFVFEEPSSTILGREDGCYPAFPKDKAHQGISRHHCLLDVHPPNVRVRDLGSRGGTYVNDKLIGQRTGEAGAEGRPTECDLKDGDTLKVCKTAAAVFQVKVFVPALCIICGKPLPEEQTPKGADSLGLAQCKSCSVDATTSFREPKRRCVQCGTDVAGQAGTERHGDFVCFVCREQLISAKSDSAAPTIDGYNIVGSLGQGGMGAVWLGRKVANDELAALKVMHARVAADQRSVKRFLQEIEITRKLRHPNVVRFIDAGYQKGTFFIALDYCEGGSVAGLMKQRGGPLPIDEAVDIILQALDGLHYAHNLFGPGKGLIHRDIKPSNLFLSGTGSSRQAKIGDYGLAKALDDTGLSGATRTGEIAGTPLFIPGQQVLNFKYATPDVDVWAMAATLYNMLTRRYPRAFPEGIDQWIAVLETDAVPIRQHFPALPKKLADVIDYALVEKPEIGFKTAAAFKKALEDAR